MNWLHVLLDLLYPPRCPGCHGDLERGGTLCIPCRARLRATPRPVDPRPPTPLATLTSLGPYHGLLRSLIRRLKFGDVRWILPVLTDEALRLHPLAPGDLLVAVPPSPGSPLDGHLAHELARALSARWRIPFLSDAVTKSRPTPPQRSLSQEERRTNLRDAFSVVRADRIRGRRLVLVDDVSTTGSTLEAVGSALRAACGSTDLHGFVLAHAPLRHGVGDDA